MTQIEPNGRRGCLIAAAVVVGAVLLRNAVDPPDGRQHADRYHYNGQRYTAPDGAVVCGSLSELNRIMDLLSDKTDDYSAARQYMTVSTCHQIQQPTLVIVEDHEGFDFVRVRAPGSAVSWYMLDNRLQ